MTIHNGSAISRLPATLRIKRAHTPRLRDEVYALRYRAYRKENAAAEDPSERFRDRFDDQPNHIVWAITLEEQVVASIRTTWFDPAEGLPVPEMLAYPDDILRSVPANARLLSGNRLVTDPELASMSAQFVFLLLRYHMLVANEKADWAIAAARTNHVAFYRRVVRLGARFAGKGDPGLLCPMHLMTCDFRENIGQVLDRTPILQPRGYERILLDGNYEEIWTSGLPIEV